MGATFLYDGTCGMCQAGVGWLKRRDSRLAYAAYQTTPPPMTLVGLSADDCQRAAYVVDERDGVGPRVYRGAAAVNYALRTLPGRRHIGWRLAGALYHLPVVRQLEDVAYAVIARNRHRLSRGGPACEI